MKNEKLLTLQILLIVSLSSFSNANQYSQEYEERNKISQSFINSFQRETDNLKEFLQSISKKIQNSNIDISSKFLELENCELLIKNIKTFYDRLEDAYYEDLERVETLLEDYSNFENVRKSKGYSGINKILFNMNNPEIVASEVEQIYKNLDALKTAELNQQATRIKSESFLKKNEIKTRPPRMWSTAFRLEEILDKFRRKLIEGENIAKSCISSFINLIQPSKCFKIQNPNGAMLVSCPSNYKKLKSSCLEICKAGYKRYGVMCLKNCSSDQVDQKMFCFNKKNSTYTEKDSYILDFLTIEDDSVTCSDNERYKSGLLCYKNCTSLGMANCGLSECASSSEMCHASSTQLPVELTRNIVNLVGFIFSIDSAKPFGWSDNVLFKSTMSNLTLFMNDPKQIQIIQEVGKILQRIKNDREMKKKFLYRVGVLSSKDNLDKDQTQLNKWNSLCQSVAESWLDIITTNSHNERKDYNKLVSSPLLEDWSNCDLKKNLDNSKSCKSSILKLISHIGSLKFIGIATQFNKGYCKNYDDSVYANIYG